MTSLLLRAIISCSIAVLLTSCSSHPKRQPAPSIIVAPTPPIYTETEWQHLPNWEDQSLLPGFLAWQNSCVALKKQAIWQKICEQAQTLPKDEATIRTFIETTFTPIKVSLSDGNSNGLVTGYYEPELRGDIKSTVDAKYPLYAPPADLILVELGSLYPDLQYRRLRGRIEGNKLIPYYSRAEIEAGKGELKPIAWAEDPIELFFLQIQGSGRIKLPDGSIFRVGYAEHNGHPFYSIGTWLIRQGEIDAAKASMQGIKAWARANPHKVVALLNRNPSFVFFRELKNNAKGPIGALGIPLTDGYSVAVDRAFTPLGIPLYLTTRYPNDQKSLNRLVVAQDTGGAIRGPIRIDFFWGSGDSAGNLAGKMKQQGQIWILWPKGAEVALPFKKG